MELTNELKEKLAGCADAEEAKTVLTEAGVELTDEALEQIAGGQYVNRRGAASTRTGRTDATVTLL